MSLSYASPVSVGEQDLPKAPQACMSCRKQKRKCNKGLPACSLCTRMSRACDYSDASPPPTSEDFNALRQKLLELEGRLNDANNNSSVIDNTSYLPATSAISISGAPEGDGASSNTLYIQQDPAYHNVQNRFPNIAFLDSDAFKYGGVLVAKPSIDIPMEVLGILGDALSVQAIISDYFDTVHTWIPIISKKRMTRNMLNPMWEAGPDLALLFLCMKLITTRPQDGLENLQNPIYTASKHFISLMESSGMTSLLVLQAYILVALYEIGQAIYPGAWMSTGSCVRYGLLLGINGHESAAELLERPSTWTEMEERRRTWWSVLIIDRVVSAGGKGRYLASEDPRSNVDLPGDTESWDQGELESNKGQSLSSPTSTAVAPFARLCQASNLLGKVIRHHLQPSTSETREFLDASTLYIELSALTRQVTQEAEASADYLIYSAPMAVCFSALCNLCDPYACHRPNSSNSAEEAAMQVQAIGGLKSVAASIKEFAEQITTYTPHALDIDRVSPLIMDALYESAANYAWMVRESGDESCQVALESIRHCLRRLGGRWRCAAEYLRILEAQEFTYAIGGSTGTQ